MNCRYNILCYLKLENCGWQDAGTGLAFIDKIGIPRYEILPAIEGLIICIRDNQMLHHTPLTEPINNTKNIVRKILRVYAGDGFEESRNNEETSRMIIALRKTTKNKN
jgi:hypothetical protein